MQGIRIIEFPRCKMVSSGTGMFGEEKFEKFWKWFSSLPRSIYPKDYLYHNGEGFCWLYLYDETLNPPTEFEIVDFDGGLYSVVTDIDQHTDMEKMKDDVDKFLSDNGFERDADRFEMGNVITSPLAEEILGFNQMDYFTPIKKKA